VSSSYGGRGERGEGAAPHRADVTCCCAPCAADARGECTVGTRVGATIGRGRPARGGRGLPLMCVLVVHLGEKTCLIERESDVFG
jgi:hypothetical protein